MKFWIKIAFLVGVTYLMCYASFFLQDQRDHHAVIRDVEAATRAVATDHGEPGEDASEIHAQLSDVQQRLTLADARWRHDASHLWLLAD